MSVALVRRSHVTDLEADDVTASELAVDGAIKHGEVACSALYLIFLVRKGGLAPSNFLLFHGVPRAFCWSTASGFRMVMLL